MSSARRASGQSAGPGGEMPLTEHLRELRTRIIRALVAITIGVIVAWFAYGPVLDFLLVPYRDAQPKLTHMGINQDLVFVGIAGAFQFQLQVSLIVGLIVSSPFWTWQLWAYVLPALHKHERRAVMVLSAVSLPLFIAGVALCYWILPRAMIILGSFNPEGATNLLTATSYLTFVTRLMLVFGIAAQVPVVVVLLHRLGVVSASQLAQARPWMIVAMFVFAALATPTPDPATMLFVAVPMTVMYLIAELIARLTDRRRGKAQPEWDDDVASPLEGPEAV